MPGGNYLEGTGPRTRWDWKASTRLHKLALSRAQWRQQSGFEMCLAPSTCCLSVASLLRSESCVASLRPCCIPVAQRVVWPS